MTSRCDQPALALQARPYVLRELSEGDCVDFEDHLAGCHACSQRVTAMADSLRRLAQDAAAEPQSAGWGAILGWRTEAALAAAVVVLLLGYPAFLGLHRLPQVERDRSDLERRTTEARSEYEKGLSDLEARTRTETDEKWRTSVFGALNQIHHLSRPVRGGTTADTLTIPGDERLVVLGVELEPANVTDRSIYRFEIRSRGGGQAWSGELSGSRVKESLRSNGEILLPVPAENLPAGDYELRVSASAGAGSEELLARRLAVIRR